MASLTGPQKLFVVRQLACFHSLAEVCDQLQETFGITAETNQIARYKVGCAAADCLSQELVDAFTAARQKFLSDEQIVPIMHRNYRARELQWMYERTKKTAPLVAARMLEQAAKESGGHYLRLHDPDASEPGDDGSEEMANQIATAYAQQPSEMAAITELPPPKAAD